MYLDSPDDIPPAARRQLARRGLVPVGDWEKHGPHEGMPFKVYVGYVGDGREVVVYPRAVYEIFRSDWSGVTPEQRIGAQ